MFWNLLLLLSVIVIQGCATKTCDDFSVRKIDLYNEMRNKNLISEDEYRNYSYRVLAYLDKFNKEYWLNAVLNQDKRYRFTECQVSREVLISFLKNLSDKQMLTYKELIDVVMTQKEFNNNCTQIERNRVNEIERINLECFVYDGHLSRIEKKLNDQDVDSLTKSEYIKLHNYILYRWKREVYEFENSIQQRKALAQFGQALQQTGNAFAQPYKVKQQSNFNNATIYNPQSNSYSYINGGQIYNPQDGSTSEINGNQIYNPKTGETSEINGTEIYNPHTGETSYIEK